MTRRIFQIYRPARLRLAFRYASEPEAPFRDFNTFSKPIHLQPTSVPLRYSKRQSATMVQLYSIAGRKIGSHWVRTRLSCPSELVKFCTSRIDTVWTSPLEIILANSSCLMDSLQLRLSQPLVASHLPPPEGQQRRRRRDPLSTRKVPTRRHSLSMPALEIYPNLSEPH